ncbi:MAG: AAA family ATPase [Candidatus Lokiarchaeota archaeon]|nr:AAA family ATPase [Candidatus Lokiarchaeota archaeon]
MGSTFIKEISLNGFKSFGDEVSIKLDRGFTAIVGPSGSGKSNIVDGLRFALCWLDDPAGRVANWGGLLHAGTKARSPANSAVVSVVLDNSQDSFPLHPGKDVTIQRVITGEGQCSFLLNRAARTREDVLAELATANINPGGFCIVPQGKASEIAYLRPEGRRALIEGLVGLRDAGRDAVEKAQLFTWAFEEVNARLGEVYAMLSPGGDARMVLEDPARPLDGGVAVEVRPRGKASGGVDTLSGGEKALLAAAFIFAVERFQPSPFYVMDAIDGGLTPPDVHRVSMAIKELASTSQLIVISNREENIANADKVCGVSIKGSTSRVFSMKMD